MIGAALSLLALAWSSGLACTSAWAALRSRPRSRAQGTRTIASVLLVRPCAGGEPALSRALRSTGAALRSPPLTVRFAVASTGDGATLACESAAAELRSAGVDAAIVVTGAVGPNRKADQIARTIGGESARAPIVIVADSDVNLTGVSLDDLMAPLMEPGVAAAWAAPVEIAPRTLADRASAAVLAASLHAFPVLAALDPDGMVGKLVAIRRDALDEVGGFDALTRYLGEDMELARRLRAAGWRTCASPRSWPPRSPRAAAGTRPPAGTPGGSPVIRAQRPRLMLAYPAVLVATPLVVVLAFGAIAAGAPVGALAAGLAMAARVLVAWLARTRCDQPVRPLSLPVDVVLADGLLLAAFVRALGSRSTIWRGVELRPDARTGMVTTEWS